jgi:two-component system sensor histidine kinase LytS
VEDITLLLFQRMGMLLILTFILTRIPLFRQLLDREVGLQNAIYFSIVFGLFGIGGTYAGVVVEGLEPRLSLWFLPLETGQAIANSTLVGVVIGGLLGGPIVGVGAGLLAGFHLYSLGGMAALGSGISAPFTGLIAGLIARFYSQERVISPTKALFIGMFAPILQMGTILIFSTPPEPAIQLVNVIGIPMVLTNSISIAVFTTMIRAALKEEERSATFETERALKIAELTLPYLKQGLTPETAEATAKLLVKELKAAAVAITDTEHILAHIGLSASHHQPGEPLLTQLSREAIATGEVQIGLSREQIGCRHHKCSLGATIVVPISQAGKVTGLIKFYYKRPQQIRTVEVVLARGLGRLISNQLNIALAEKIAGLMKEAEMRLLQAQIHPHFLFNTLNSIVSLIRIQPDMARHITVQLANYLRLNLKVTNQQTIPLEQEIAHLQAYLEIIQIRFEDQLTVDCLFEPGIGQTAIPPATLQPLVENSIHHGLKNRPKDGQITIIGTLVEDHVRITLSDNGTGISEDSLNTLGQKPVESKEGTGIGVHNVNQRLVTALGPQARLRFENVDEGGAKIWFDLPITSKGGS